MNIKNIEIFLKFQIYDFFVTFKAGTGTETRKNWFWNLKTKNNSGTRIGTLIVVALIWVLLC